MSAAPVDDLQSVVRGGPSRGGAGDRVFRGIATGAGVIILATLAGVALFLVIKAWPAITANSKDLPNSENLAKFIWPLLFGTLVAATIAIVIAVPMSVCVALFISHIAPRRIAQPMSYLIDLLAAIPSVIYGLWGIAVLGPHSLGLLQWLSDNLGFIPFFKGPASTTGRTMLVAGAVLAVMILPIITAVTRSVFEQTPRRLQEGALALGATRWEMIRLTVLPFGRSAIISSSMLGLGRALGETMAVAIVLSVSGDVTFNWIGSANPSTIAANIALDFPESSGVAVNALIASGLVLFAVTLVVNMAARSVINRQIRI
jgi:phosphate transport system permease protein